MGTHVQSGLLNIPRTGRFWPAILALPFALQFVGLALDPLPRFFLGDSPNYLAAHLDGYLPVERSWIYGLFAAELLHGTHNYTSYLILQSTAYATLIALSYDAFRMRPVVCAFFPLFCILASLDPVTNLYIRMYLADFAAFAFFAAFLIALNRTLESAGQSAPTGLPLGLGIVCVVLCILMRTSYVPVILLTLIFIVVFQASELNRRAFGLILYFFATPIVALEGLAYGNSYMFVNTMHGQPFTSPRAATVFLCVFAPALEIEDFHDTGVNITQEEFDRFDVGNYIKRDYQRWGEQEDSIAFYLHKKFEDADTFSLEPDRVAGKILRHAILRNPLGIARVYLGDLKMYFSRGNWEASEPTNAGVNQLLPDDFIESFNSQSDQKIYATLSTVESPFVTFNEVSAKVGPIFLVAGITTAVVCLLLFFRRKDCGIELILGCAFLASFLPAPAYSAYVIPRYFMACYFTFYLMIVLLLARTVEAVRGGLFENT